MTETELAWLQLGISLLFGMFLGFLSRGKK